MELYLVAFFSITGILEEEKKCAQSPNVNIFQEATALEK
jgi:hypothetical protein